MSAHVAHDNRIYVLIHGSFHGGWCWDQVAVHMHKAGCDVLCPDLVGVASDADGATVDMQTHIAQIVRLIKDLGNCPITLVGHSYAGMLLPAVAAANDAVDCLIYLDAFVPNAGESAFMLLGPLGNILRQEAADDPAQHFRPPPVEVFGVTDPDHIALLKTQLRPMPASTHEQAAVMGACEGDGGPKRHYILCEKFDGFHNQAKRAENAGWPVIRLSAGHDAMISDAEDVADAILHICRQPFSLII